MTKLSAQGAFRTDIQGLRAIAVIAVVLYHLKVAGFSGGYVGVDVFFVISGFLITGHLARDAEERKFSAARFYARRVRRLLPLSALVLVVTFVAMFYLTSKYRVRSSVGEGVWVTLFSSNMYFLRQQTDYFAATSTPSAFQHYWSLALEEQFYLVWPWLYLAARSIGRRFGRPNATGSRMILFIMGLSFTYSIWLMQRSQPMAFYLLPARAWELGAGGILALSYKRRSNTALANTGLILGVAGIAASVFLYDETTRFPGVTAVLPVVSTVLCLAFGESASTRNLISVALSSRPAQTIGRLSYSIYLWHWPMIVLASPAGFKLSRWTTMVGIAVATIVLSYGTERWVERPFRSARPSAEGTSSSSAARIFVGIVGSCLALLILFAYTFDADRFPTGEAAPIIAAGELPTAIAEQTLGSLPSNLYPPLLQARQIVPSIWSAGCQQEVGYYDPNPCLVGERGDRPVVAIFGDSHMAMWEPSLEHLADAGEITILSYSKSACSPYDLPIYPKADGTPFTDCGLWREGVYENLAAQNPDVILLSGYWIEAARDDWADGIALTASRLPPESRVVLIGQTPNLPGHTPDCLAENTTSVEQCGMSLDEAIQPSVREGEAAATASVGWGYVDPSVWLCANHFCPPLVDSTLLYMDDHHVTVAATELLRPQFVEAIGLGHSG